MNKKIKEIIEALEFMGKTGDVSSIAVESLKNGLEELDEQLILSGVSQQREQLEGFVDWFNANDKTQAILSERIEEYLKTL